MRTSEALDQAVCQRYQAAIELIGRRWTGAILLVLMDGSATYSEILCRVPDLSDRLLSERLKELEQQGLLLREVLPSRPPSVRYSLSKKGTALRPVVEGLQEWVARWADS